MSQPLNIITVGNPNCGKTTLFNGLTGARQQVGNWSGVTVDKKVGQFTVGNQGYQLTDLPGIYSFDNAGDSSSLDEQIAFNYVLKQQPDLIINVVDACAIERSLYLTLQLRELGFPVLVVLNKMDSAEQQHLRFDLAKLSDALGCPVYGLSAHDSKQVKGFKQALPELIATHFNSSFSLDYGSDFNAEIAQLTGLSSKVSQTCSATGIALKLIEGDPQVLQSLNASEQSQVAAARAKLDANHDVDLHLADARYSLIYKIVQQGVSHQGKLSLSLSDKIDNLVLNKWLGIPVFLAVMYLLFMFSINIGSSFIDFFDISFGAIFVDGAGHLLEQWGAPIWLVAILANGIGSGIQTVATFIPVIACLYLFLSLLESSGYLARAAFVIDKLMQKMGLPGKAFVPMIVGFGCTVPAVMASRTLDQERERLLTSIMSPFMSCGARLPVYALFAAAFFPDNGQNLVFVLYLTGILVAVFTGLVLSRTLLPGKSENTILELPDYEIPKARNIVLKTWHKLKSFVLGAGKTIVIVVALLSFLNSLGTDGSFGNEDSEHSVLSAAAQFVTPVFAPMGISQDNWPATVGVITGVFAKEAVVGTLNSLYSTPTVEDEAEFDLAGQLMEAINTIPDNLVNLSFSDPMGLDVGDLSDAAAVADEQQVNVSVFSDMQQRFDGQAGAFAYLLFILLYIPCAAAMGALVREVGQKWALFTAGWTTAIAYMSSVFVYQLARFNAHPSSSLAWLVGIVVITLVAIALLKQQGKRVKVAVVFNDPAKA
ncbi:Fe(2+) transporter permease subunit FeoB [Motilimonas eburnea]|uniref:Fe(2+) transporter permease subunit FeoB n=1 Tax=Motilimonas eburnea TaxID=1737488 RepID=UPI001E62541D|nr:Fe(2+) transporter permease subunit FeoB [Motilimonas eburnea]MCE2570230.1 Fe(2+) transporter permease subunit FeoB [Motilimonas eburnea]